MRLRQLVDGVVVDVAAGEVELGAHAVRRERRAELREQLAGLHLNHLAHAARARSGSVRALVLSAQGTQCDGAAERTALFPRSHFVKLGSFSFSRLIASVAVRLLPNPIARVESAPESAPRRGHQKRRAASKRGREKRRGGT